MELDELKDQLKNKLANDHTGRSDADIAGLLNKRTVSIVTKLKNSLRFEIIFCLVVIAVFSFIGITNSYWSLRVYFSVFAVLMAVVVLLLTYLLRRTAKLSSTHLPVKNNLQLIVNNMDVLMKRYFQFTMLLVPVCCLFAFGLAFYEKAHFQPVSLRKHFTAAQVMIGLSLYLIAITVFAYYFTRWYLRKLYGNYVNQLKRCMEELSEA